MSRGRRRERGAASWVTILMILGIAAGAYAAVVFVPVWVLHYEVKQVVRDMVHKIRTLEQVDAVDEAGRKARVPVVDIHKQDVTWERSTDPLVLHVEFEYPRVLELPWLDRRIERVYRVNLTMDLKRADWGPTR
jgi:hypothetical protein